MDRLEAVELTLSDVLNDNHSSRFDSEYFQKNYLNNIAIIKSYDLGYMKFGEVIKNITGGATPLGADYPDKGIRFLRVQNIMQNYIDDSDLVYISATSDLELQRSKLKEDDVLLTITGVSYGKSAVVTKDFDGCNINQHSVKITLNTKYFLPHFISTFLNSNKGKLQSDKNIVGVTRPALDYTAIKNFLVPLVTLNFQLSISHLIHLSDHNLIKAKKIYQQAEDLLLTELGLKDWKPTEESIAVKSFSESFLSSGRLDAEYYQPKFYQVEEAIQSCSFHSQRLGSLIEPIQNGFDYREYTEEGTPYIRVGDVKNGQINFESAVKIPMTISDIDKPVGLKTGDILFTRKGSFGNSAVVTELELNAIISSEIMLLRLTSVFKQEILPEYVSLFLNSKFGYLQVERRVHGVAYYSISQPDLANLLIPMLPISQQQKIVEKIKLSFVLKQKSKQLLEIAKIGVEKAIETDEETATAWINQQLESLGVKLI
ncbi:restriction endonuclease subunit S [Microcystis panniformis]|uniref:restriction endonuclease subunit S n=1 Tax=Microcystis panniformis TaxID=513223 RepID=UPI000689E4F5|nr:restriction endonuclease subunit S [Microcystis panniformis]